MTQLTYDECDVIIDALEKWEDQPDIGGALFSSLLGSMVDDPEAKAEIERNQKEREQQKEIEKRERKRRAIKLKAKIFDIQEKAIKNEMGVTPKQ